jgi:uncharacterized membrane protein
MEFSKKEIISTSWLQTKTNLPILVIITTIYLMIILALLQIFTFMLPDLSENLISENPTQIFNIQIPTLQQILFIISSILFVIGINLGFIKICINIFKKENINIKHLFGSFDILLPYLMATICYGAAHILIALPGIIVLIIFLKLITGSFFYYLGILFVIIPTIYLSLRLQFYIYFLIDDRVGLLESLKMSFLISKGYTYQLLIIGAILSIIIQISIIPFFIGLIIALPYSKMTTTYTYIKLKETLKP